MNHPSPSYARSPFGVNDASMIPQPPKSSWELVVEKRSITAARSAAAYGDDFTADDRPSHLHFSSPFAPFLLLIEDPEVNIMR